MEKQIKVLEREYHESSKKFYSLKEFEQMSVSGLKEAQS